VENSKPSPRPAAVQFAGEHRRVPLRRPAAAPFHRRPRVPARARSGDVSLFAARRKASEFRGTPRPSTTCDGRLGSWIGGTRHRSTQGLGQHGTRVDQRRVQGGSPQTSSGPGPHMNMKPPANVLNFLCLQQTARHLRTPGRPGRPRRDRRAPGAKRSGRSSVVESASALPTGGRPADLDGRTATRKSRGSGWCSAWMIDVVALQCRCRGLHL